MVIIFFREIMNREIMLHKLLPIQFLISIGFFFGILKKTLSTIMQVYLRVFQPKNE